LTFALKGHLRTSRSRISGSLPELARFRDEKLWAALKHKSLELASEDLGLGHASLYHYLQVYDWRATIIPPGSGRSRRDSFRK